MAVEDEKLKRFEQAIFSQVEAQAASVSSELEAYQARQIEKAADEELEKSYALLQSRRSQLHAEFSRRVTQEKLSARQRLLQYRRERIDTLFEEAGEALSAFAAGPDYPAWIRSALAPYAGLLEGGELLVRQEDVALFQGLFPGAPVRVDGGNRLGGFAIQNRSLNQYLDETFATLLEGEKERFYEGGSLGLEIGQGPSPAPLKGAEDF